MGLKEVVYLVSVVLHTANAFYPLEFVELSRIPSKVDFDSVEDAILSSGISRRSSVDDSDEDSQQLDFSVGVDPISDEDYEHNYAASESSFYHSVDRNDAADGSEIQQSDKRNDYYETREKKSQHMPSVPRWNKKFHHPQNHQTENEDSGASAAPERNSRNRMTHSMDGERVTQLSRYDDYYPSRQSASQPESRHPNRPMSRKQRSRTYRLAVEEQDEFPDASNVYERSSEQQTEDLDTAPVVVRAIMRRPDVYEESIPSRAAESFNVPSINKSHLKKYRPSQKSRTTEKYAKPMQPLPRFTTNENQNQFGAATGFQKATRQQFHEQGIKGPHSYKFGYNTGDQDNPMARYEERDEDGMVRGSYSYIDPLGKRQVVHYESHPKFGFRTNLGGDN